MTIDPGKTVSIIKQGLTRPEDAWQDNPELAQDWRHSAALLAGPLVVVSALVSALFAAMYGTAVYGGGWFRMLLMGIVGGAVGMVIASFVFSFLAGHFGGKSDFNRAFAALSVAAIPGFIGSLVGAVIPFVGALLAIVGGIVSLVYFYRLIPLALEVPDGRRGMHFALGLVLVFVANILLFTALGPRVTPTLPPSSYSDSAEGEAPRGSGLVGQMQRMGEVMDRAGSQQYEPPADGEISRAQLEAYLTVLQKTRAAQARYQQKVEDMQTAMEGQEKPSLAQLAQMGSGITGALSAQNAEMEIVVTGGGNWAEHNWVKNQIQTAVLHAGEGTPEIEHNYELVKPHLDSLQ